MNFRLETNNDLSNDDFRRLCADENAFRDMIVFDQVSFQKYSNAYQKTSQLLARFSFRDLDSILKSEDNTSS